MTARFANVDPSRHRIMSAVRDRDTKPEMIERRLLFSPSYRYRLDRKDLPGKPDIAFARPRKAILVHGCFWHSHARSAKATVPKTRAEFRAEKFVRNVERDPQVEDPLAKGGWSSLVIWECETRSPNKLVTKLRAFLDEGGATHSQVRVPQ